VQRQKFKKCHWDLLSHPKYIAWRIGVIISLSSSHILAYLQAIRSFSWCCLSKVVNGRSFHLCKCRPRAPFYIMRLGICHKHLKMGRYALHSRHAENACVGTAESVILSSLVSGFAGDGQAFWFGRNALLFYNLLFVDYPLFSLAKW
jgi:hypothetical protein